MVHTMDPFQKGSYRQDHARLNFLHATQSLSVIPCDLRAQTLLQVFTFLCSTNTTVLSCRTALSLFQRI